MQNEASHGWNNFPAQDWAPDGDELVVPVLQISAGKEDAEKMLRYMQSSGYIWFPVTLKPSSQNNGEFVLSDPIPGLTTFSQPSFWNPAHNIMADGRQPPLTPYDLQSAPWISPNLYNFCQPHCGCGYQFPQMYSQGSMVDCPAYPQQLPSDTMTSSQCFSEATQSGSLGPNANVLLSADTERPPLPQGPLPQKNYVAKELSPTLSTASQSEIVQPPQSAAYEPIFPASVDDWLSGMSEDFSREFDIGADAIDHQ